MSWKERGGSQSPRAEPPHRPRDPLRLPICCRSPRALSPHPPASSRSISRSLPAPAYAPRFQKKAPPAPSSLRQLPGAPSNWVLRVGSCGHRHQPPNCRRILMSLGSHLRDARGWVGPQEEERALAWACQVPGWAARGCCRRRRRLLNTGDKVPKSSRGGSWHPVTQALPFSHGLRSEGLVHQKQGAGSQGSRWHHQVTAGALHVRQKTLSDDTGEKSPGIAGKYPEPGGAFQCYLGFTDIVDATP